MRMTWAHVTLLAALGAVLGVMLLVATLRRSDDASISGEVPHTYHSGRDQPRDATSSDGGTTPKVVPKAGEPSEGASGGDTANPETVAHGETSRKLAQFLGKYLAAKFGPESERIEALERLIALYSTHGKDPFYEVIESPNNPKIRREALLALCSILHKEGSAQTLTPGNFTGFAASETTDKRFEKILDTLALDVNLDRELRAHAIRVTTFLEPGKTERIIGTVLTHPNHSPAFYVAADLIKQGHASLSFEQSVKERAFAVSRNLNASEEDRLDALAVLSLDADHLFESAKATISDPSEKIRHAILAQAARQLDTHPGHKALLAVVEQICAVASSGKERPNRLYFISSLGSPEIRPQCGQAIRACLISISTAAQESAGVRVQAIDSLSRGGYRQAVTVLEALSKDTSQMVAEAAQKALENLQ